MTLPTPRHIDDLFDQYGRVPFRRLRDRLKAELEVDRRVPQNEADGYPGSTLGGGRGGAELTSVEAAAEKRLAGRGHDRRHRYLEEAWQHALEARVHLFAVERLVNLMDLERQEDGDARPAPKTCEHCTGKRGRQRGEDNLVHRTGSVGERLRRDLALCEPCYFFVERRSKAGALDAQLPTPEQIRRHEERGNWEPKMRGNRVA